MVPSMDHDPPNPEFMISLTAHGFNRLIDARDAYKNASVSPESSERIAEAEHLAELRRKLAATAPTDPDFERLVDAVEDYAQYCDSRSRGRLA